MNNIIDFDISQEIDDAIVSYFEKYTGVKESARLLAGSIITTAKSQNLDPMAVLKKFMEMPAGQLNDYLVMFLNYNRYGSSLLGLSNQPMPNKYVTRMILV